MPDVDTINRLAEDPDFHSLSDVEQKAVLGQMGLSATQQPQPKPQIKTAGIGPILLPGVENFVNKHHDTLIDFLRPFAAGVGAAFVGAASGPAAIPASLATYTGIDTLLQYLKENKPKSVTDALTSGVINAGVNEVGGAAIRGLMRTGKAVINAGTPDAASILNLEPTASQALKATGHPIAGSTAKVFEDVFNTGGKAAALDRTAGKGFSRALQMVGDPDIQAAGGDPNLMFKAVQKYLPNENEVTPVKVTPGQKYVPQTKTTTFQPYTEPSVAQSGPVETTPFADSYKTLDKVISDPDRLQSTLSKASEIGTGYNLKRSLQDYQFMRMFNDAVTQDVTNPGQIRINPQALANSWTAPDMQSSLKILYNQQQRNDISKFFKNIENVQDKMSSHSMYKTLVVAHAGIAIAAGLFTGSLAATERVAGMAGLYIPAMALGKILTNTKTARLLTAMAGGEPLGVSQEYAGRVITNVLQGSAIALIDKDGNKTPGVIDRNGKFVASSQ